MARKVGIFETYLIRFIALVSLIVFTLQSVSKKGL